MSFIVAIFLHFFLWTRHWGPQKWNSLCRRHSYCQQQGQSRAWALFLPAQCVLDYQKTSVVKVRDWARWVPTYAKRETGLDLHHVSDWFSIVLHNILLRCVLSIYWPRETPHSPGTQSSVPSPSRGLRHRHPQVSPLSLCLLFTLLSPFPPNSHCPNLFFSGKIQRGGTSNCWTLGSWVGMELGPLPKSALPLPPAALMTLYLTLETHRMAGRRERYPR